MNCPFCPIAVNRVNLVKHINKQHRDVLHPVEVLSERGLVQHHCGTVCTVAGLTKHSNRCLFVPVEPVPADEAVLAVVAEPVLDGEVAVAAVPDDFPFVEPAALVPIAPQPLPGAPNVNMYDANHIMLQRFLALVTMPEPPPLVHQAHHQLFCHTVENLCTRLRDADTVEQKEEILFRLLCLPKLGIQRAIGASRQRMQVCSTGDIYSLFPPLNAVPAPIAPVVPLDVIPPAPPLPVAPIVPLDVIPPTDPTDPPPLLPPAPAPVDPVEPLTHSEKRRILQYVETYKLKKAAAAVRGDATVATLTDEVLAVLHAKHPQGPINPFANLPMGNAPAEFDDTDKLVLSDVVKQLSRDTSPGISGWSTELIQLCYRKVNDNPFRHFLLSLGSGMLAGTAPGRVMLCSSRLTPLLQNGKIRPIACGEMFYRLVMRFLLKVRSVADDALLDIQLGVGTPGGVEPIIEQIHRELVNHAADPNPRCVYSLDFENAFNKVSRVAIAEAVSNHAGHLFRLTQWAYGTQTPLVCRAKESFVQLSSSQGVRQGDPLGPLLFSLVMRPKLQQLKTIIANEVQDVTMAYLDDVNVTSNRNDLMVGITDLFNGHDGLTLNVNKSKCETITNVSTNLTGIQVLGSAHGTTEARRAFLTRKIDAVEGHLRRLRDLPHQVALLLLRQCIQPQLKHLLRTMELGDLVPELQRLDELVYGFMDHIRGASDLPRDETTQRIYSLPLSQGGCGLLSYVETRASARDAGRDDAAHQLRRMNVTYADPMAGGVLPAPVPQRLRCKRVLEPAVATFVDALPMEKRLVFYDNSSKCGSAWMHAIAVGKHRLLSDKQVAAALNIRVLRTDLHDRNFCTRCTQAQGILHSEHCANARMDTSARHNHIRNLLADFVKSSGRMVTLEPPLINNNNPARADLLVSDAEGMLQFGRHVDLSIKLVLAHDTLVARNAVTGNEVAEPGESQRRQCYSQLNAALTKAVEDKNLHYAQLPQHANVIPLVMSSGGTLHKTFHLFLKELQPDALLRRQFLIDASLALVRARASTYALA